MANAHLDTADGEDIQKRIMQRRKIIVRFISKHRQPLSRKPSFHLLKNTPLSGLAFSWIGHAKIYASQVVVISDYCVFTLILLVLDTGNAVPSLLKKSLQRGILDRSQATDRHTGNGGIMRKVS